MPLQKLQTFTLFSDKYTRRHFDTHVCLNMIAKNEMTNLAESLTAAAPHISGWIMCDTGSTDGSQAFVERFFAVWNISGQVVQHNWKNFAENRNLCLQAGRALLRECDFWLLLDADQVMVSTDGLQLGALGLNKDAYWLEERSHGTIFSNLRVVNASQDWKYHGAVHEAIWRDGDKDIGTLPPSIFSKHDTDGARSLNSDADLLEKALESNPKDPRSHFYLGNTYFSMKQYDKAIQHYTERIVIGGWHEEVYYSAFRLALALEQYYINKTVVDNATYAALEKWVPLNDTRVDAYDVLVAYEAATTILPYRKEAKYKLANFVRLQFGDLKKCYQYASEARDAGPHSITTLFLDSRVQEFGVNDELCICAFYAGAIQAGLEACEQVLQKLELVDWNTADRYLKDLKKRTLENKVAYMNHVFSSIASAHVRAI
jgi:tetratricopeptide (TPR) repeat protein